MNQLPFLDSDSFTNPQSSELEVFLKCIKDAEGENAQRVCRFLLIAPFPNCAINLPNIEVTLVSDVTDEKCCPNGVAFDAILYIGDNITFSDSVINYLKKICTNNAQHTPLFVACQIEKSEWLMLSKEFVCVDHIRYSKGTKALPYLNIACFPDYEIATEYGVTHDSHCHKLINVGVRTIADQIQRLYNIALHPLPTTITFYEGSNEVRNANPWIVKQAHYRNPDCRSLQSIFLTLAGLAQRLPEYKPIYTWLTSPEMQNVIYADSFEIFVSKSKEGEVNVSSKEIGIPEEIINECIAVVSASDVDVVAKEGAVVAGEFGSSGNASSLDDNKKEFVRKWHDAFWEDYKKKSKRYKNFFNEAWRFYTSIMRGGQKISEENFKYFIFSRAYILGKNSESRLLFFPYWSEIQQRPLFAALMIYKKYSKAKHYFLIDLLERTAHNLENLYIISLKELESIKSAIGAIMSRNGSHNIGSHVLSALSHNVGTMPDDRVLYQYIQHRMDYIATATTDFPQWTTPTMFVAGLMKNFYAQKHLLDYISRSEGLRAYKFQERNLDDAARMNQHGTIRIFLRRFYKLNEPNQRELPHEHRYLTYDQYGQAWSIYYFFGEKDKMFRQKFSENKRTQYEVSESGGTAKFLEYDERFTPDWKQDVRIAIPGGIVGQHAFYTIIENVIRNAAKHGWASEKNLTEKDLEVYIDFGEKKATGNVVFTIGDNVSDVFGGATKFWADFFAAFSCSDKKDPFRYWRAFCTKGIRHDLANAIKKADGANGRSDGYPNFWKGVWKTISDECVEPENTSMSSSQNSEIELLDEIKDKKALEIACLLLRAYTTPLETSEDGTKDDVRTLEEYLNERNKDRPASEAKLPLIYHFQHEYLLESIAKYNVSCYVEGKESAGKVQMRSNVDIIADIRHAIIYDGLDKVILEDADIRRHYETCLKEIIQCRENIRLLSTNQFKNDEKIEKTTRTIDEKVQHVFSLDSITAYDVKRIGDVANQEPLNSNEKIVRYYLLRRISNNWPYKKFLTGNIPHNPEWNLGRRLILPLHHDQQRKLAQSFIDSEGKLRKENWGLAEMKISAGYLAQRETSEIGGLDVKGNSIIVPVAMPGLCRNADNPHNCLMCRDRNRMACYESDSNCPLKKHKYHLGYRFEIAKPKDILIIVDDINSITKAIKDNSHEGIEFALQVEQDGNNKWYGYRRILSNGEVDGEIERFNYRYVVHAGKSNKDAQVMVPRHRFGFRYIIWDDKEKNRLINLVNSNDTAELRKVIFSVWIKRLAIACRGLVNHSVKLIVNVDGNEEGRERGLVTRKDLLHTMFVECYHTALISFLKNPPESLALSDTSRNLIALLSLIKVIPDAMVEPQQDYGHGDDKGAKEYIRAQLVWYCDLLKSHLMLSSEFIAALKSIELYVKDGAGTGDAVITRKIEDISKDFEKAIARRLFRGKQDEDYDIKRWCKELIAFLRKVDKKELDGWLDAFHGGSDRYNCPHGRDSYGRGRHSFEDNLKAIITACSVPEEDEFNALVESLNSMFLASDVYLRKYEERIATLPEAYKHDGANRETKGDGSANVESVQVIADTLLCQKLNDESNCKAIKYSRHDHSMPAMGIYSEALSGSQSYLNALSRLVYASGEDKTGERYASVARLLENAFLRILIIDERVMNFVEERRSDEMKKTLIDMGIWVADVVNEGVSRASSEVKDELYRFKHSKDVVKSTNDSRSQYIDIDPGQFDILVIHQGIIDKWWERHDESRVKEILEDLRLSIPRVVVTTGRGRPENIPADEKVLPFSVIESSLFKRYPEKLIFVNTIMNLLPYGTDKTKVS